MLTVCILGTSLLSVQADPGDSSSPFADTTEEEIDYLVREADEWIRQMRDRHRPRGRPLTDEEKRRFAGFFPADVLERARVTLVSGIENPGFLSVFTDRGKPLPIDFRQMTGLALGDTILVNRSKAREDHPSWLPLLFHELVHHVQDKVLGEESYMAEYVRGWARHGYRYRSIPIEVQAYELADRFRADPGSPFSVLEQVERRFGDPGE